MERREKRVRDRFGVLVPQRRQVNELDPLVRRRLVGRVAGPAVDRDLVSSLDEPRR